MTAPDTRDSVTPPDSVERIALEMKAHSVMGSRIAELDEWATRLQALDRQRQEECEHLRSMYRNACKKLALANEATLQARAAAEGVERDAARWHEGEVSQVEWEDSDRIIVHIEKDEGDVVMWEDVREGARVRVTPMRDSGEGLV